MLEKQRKRIDEIDQELIKLFEERTQTVEEVAEIKLANNIDILDSGREEKVIEKVQNYLKNSELKDEVADLYQNIMRISREHQKEWMVKKENIKSD